MVVEASNADSLPASIASLLVEIKDRRAFRKQLLIFDRDGTLVPFADTPQLAVMDPQVTTALKELSLAPDSYIGILSARGLNQLRLDADEHSLILAGNYGMEISYPDGTIEVQPDAQHVVPEIGSVYSILQKKIAPMPGIILENHGLTLCLHTNLVSEIDRAKVDNAMHKLQINHGQLKIRNHTTNYEILPQLVWDKSYALGCIQKHLFQDDRDTFYLFAGDSEYDEPGFNWVNQHAGVSIRVGPPGVPTVANFVLESPEVLHKLIYGLVNSL